MKNIKSLFTIGGIVLLISCGTTQEPAQKESQSVTTNSNRGRSNTETPSRVATRSSESSRIAQVESSKGRTVDRHNEAAEAENFKRMYSDLEMTPDQIDKFETEWSKSLEAWKRTNRNKVMNNYERIEYQDRILRDILSESQFESYQEWVRENAD